MSNNFEHVSDDEIIGRLNALLEKYEKLSPDLSKMLKEWSRTRREIEAVSKEAKKRNINA